MMVRMPTARARLMLRWMPLSMACCGLLPLERRSPMLVVPTKKAAPMAPAMGLTVVMMAAPCGLSYLGRALRPWVSPVMQADTDTAIRANMAERAAVWVSIFR